ncbi:MAG TPA: hypothetical protein PLE92_04315 [Lentisphaeria bacterium]|nr:hypothetical protein [Lentisphaeria bacterium]
MQPIVYGREECPECEILKLWLEGKKIQFDYQHSDNIFLHQNKDDIMAKLAEQDMKLPVVWWDGNALSACEFKKLATCGFLLKGE